MTYEHFTIFLGSYLWFLVPSRPSCANEWKFRFKSLNLLDWCPYRISFPTNIIFLNPPPLTSRYSQYKQRPKHFCFSWQAQNRNSLHYIKHYKQLRKMTSNFTHHSTLEVRLRRVSCPSPRFSTIEQKTA